MKLPIITLMGPTASGKTRLAIELVQKYPLEIVSVDSAMIYETMDIGTGKPSKTELEKAPHQLIDFLDPAKSYSAFDFCQDALKCVEKIHQNHKIPLLAGGTMMYFDALIHGIAPLPAANANIRKSLNEEAHTHGLNKLHQRLKKVDAKSAELIHPNDPARIIRALEVYEITGQPLSYLKTRRTPLSHHYEVIQLAIFPEDRKNLHQDIETRFLQMLKQGLVDEVKTLKAREDLSENMPSMRSVGYRQVWQYLEGAFDETTMVDKAVAATRQLAKRQMTWLRSWPEVQCFSKAAHLNAKAEDFIPKSC